MKNLTEKQQALLDYIRNYQLSHGVAPTYRDLKKAFGLSSLGSVYKYVKILQAKGCLTYDPKKWRTLQVIDSDRKEHAISQLSIIGTLSKGKQVELFARIETILMPQNWLPQGPCYGFCIQDNSFEEKMLRENDLLVIEAEKNPIHEMPETLLLCYSKGSRVQILETREYYISCENDPQSQVKPQGIVRLLLRNYRSSFSSSGSGSKSSKA